MAGALRRAGQTDEEREVIVSGSVDGTVQIWDASGGERPESPLSGHIDVVSAVAVGRI